MWKQKVSAKNKTKIALSAQYFLSRPNNPEVIYVLVSIKYHIGNDMDQGHYICDVLDYSTGISLEQSFEYTKKARRISHEKKTHLGKSCVTMNDLMSKFYEPMS